MLCFLAGFSVVTRRSRRRQVRASADRATRLSATYQDARHWVGEQKSVERQYRIEGSYAVVAAHRQAERRLIADLDHVLELDSSPATRATVARLLRLQADYHSASQALFNAVDENDQERVLWFDHSAVDPVFGVLADVIYRQAAAASASALAHSAALRGDEVRANRTIAIAVASRLLLVAFFGAIVVRYGRRLDAAVAAEVERLAEMAITDPLTGLRNHRAFHEDVARELQRAGRTGVPLALVLLDLDDLKTVNDTQGHQAGDERLQALADAIRATGRGADSPTASAATSSPSSCPTPARWGALEFAQRLRAATQAGTHGAGPFTATAGISEALDAALQGRVRARGRPRAHRRQAHPPGRRHLRPRPGPERRPRRRRGRASHAHAGQRARARRGRQGLLHAQPLPDRVAAVRPDRRRAGLRGRAAHAPAPGRAAARRGQDRRARTRSSTSPPSSPTTSTSR